MTTHRTPRPRRRIILCTVVLALSAALTGACVGNLNGETYSASVGTALPLFGYATAPGVDVSIQVLKNANLSPYGPDTDWVEIGTTTSELTSSLTFGTTDLYRWEADVVPVPNVFFAARWPQGGLVRLRVELDNFFMSVTLDEIDCISAAYSNQEDFLTALDECKSHDSGVLTFADIDDANGNVPVPAVPFLTRTATTLQEATDYYKAVGALDVFGLPTAQRGTLNFWKTTNGFPNGEINATYYNKGDLGFGRDMHCRTTTYGKACYVTNYGNVADGLDDIASALDDAVNKTSPVATVAMEWHATPASGQDAVRFFVYSAAGTLVKQASLDSNPTLQAIPGLCLSCHGGFYNSNTNQVTGAQFLPFDVESFAYHGSKPYSSQVAQLRSLNLLVKDTLVNTDLSHKLISGWYPNANSSFQGDFIPSDWQGSKESEILYTEVYRPYCQMCHNTRSYLPNTYSKFTASKALIADRACSANIQMPHAEVTFHSFWQSSARAHLVGALGINDACDGK